MKIQMSVDIEVTNRESINYKYAVLSELKINPSVEFLNSFLLQDHGR